MIFFSFLKSLKVAFINRPCEFYSTVNCNRTLLDHENSYLLMNCPSSVSQKLFGWALIISGGVSFMLLAEVFFVLYLNEPSWGILLAASSLSEVIISTFSRGGLTFPVMICFVEIIMIVQLYLGLYFLRKAID